MQLYLLLCAIAPCMVSCSKLLLHAVPSAMYVCEQVEMDFHSLSAGRFIGFVRSCHRRGVRLVSGRSELRSFTNRNFDTVPHDHQ